MARPVGLLIAIATALALPAPAQAAKPAAHRQRCAAADYHVMDYMIGEWDVVDTKTGAHFLFNRVEPVNDGCAVRESLVMQKDTPGLSITFFSAEDRRWYSYYHAPGVHAVLEGAATANGGTDLATTMILPGSKEPQQVRQVTDRDAAGRPHQTGYVKAGAEWKPIWDLTFCARSGAAKPEAPCPSRTSRHAE